MMWCISTPGGRSWPPNLSASACSRSKRRRGKRSLRSIAGSAGTTTLHCLDILLNKIVPLKPDVVVMMENINDLIVLVYDRTYWNHNPSKAPIVDFTFYKNLKGLRALSTLARDMYIPNLHAAFRVLSHKISAKGKDPDDEFAQERGQEERVGPGRNGR